MAIKELKLDFLAKIKKPEFQVRRKMLSKIIEGELAASTKGRGIEFTGFRKYVYGDDASSIDWPASLRAKESLIREYEEYKHFQILILLDVSDSMLFSSTEKLKCEFATELAFSIVYSVVNSGNKVGLCMFNDQLVTKRPPQSGTDNYYRILKDLSKPELYGGKFDLTKALWQTKALLNDKSLIIIVSDFLGLKKGWEKYIRMMAQRFEIMGVMVRDPRDREMPNDAGQFLLQDPFSGEKILVDAKDYAKIYKEQSEKQEKEIKRGFETSKSGLVIVQSDQDFLKPILKYVQMRSKILQKLEG